MMIGVDVGGSGVLENWYIKFIEKLYHSRLIYLSN